MEISSYAYVHYQTGGFPGEIKSSEYSASYYVITQLYKITEIVRVI